MSSVGCCAVMAMAMMLLDVVQDQEVVHDHKGVRSFGGVKMFEVIEC